GTKYILGLVIIDHVLWVLGTNQEALGYNFNDLTLSAFDVTDPLDLQWLTTVPIPGTTDSSRLPMVSLGNSFMVISNLNEGISVVNVSDPLNPTYATNKYFFGREVQRQGNILFAVDGNGLYLYRIG